MMKDIEAQMDIIRERAIKSGTGGYKPSDVRRAIDKVMEEYNNPLEDDVHGTIHEELEAKYLAELEANEERLDAQMDEIEKALDSDEEMKVYRSGLIERMSKYDTDDFKIAEYLEKQYPIEEEPESEGEEAFEEKSMFDPNQNAEWVRANRGPKLDKVKFLEETDNTNDITIDPRSGFGSKDAHKRSNENLYNLRHSSKNGLLGKNANSKQLDEICKKVTQYRRDIFKKIKAEQKELPVDQRVPHYLDKNGMPVPYPADKIEEETYNILNMSAEDAINDVSIDEYLGMYKNFAPVSERTVDYNTEFS